MRRFWNAPKHFAQKSHSHPISYSSSAVAIVTQDSILELWSFVHQQRPLNLCWPGFTLCLGAAKEIKPISMHTLRETIALSVCITGTTWAKMLPGVHLTSSGFPTSSTCFISLETIKRCEKSRKSAKYGLLNSCFRAQHPDSISWANISTYDNSLFTLDSLRTIEHNKTREKIALLGMQKRWHMLQRQLQEEL